MGYVIFISGVFIGMFVMAFIQGSHLGDIEGEDE